jgi:peptidyl-prolyl cis-trans isomerase SurA
VYAKSRNLGWAVVLAALTVLAVPARPAAAQGPAPASPATTAPAAATPPAAAPGAASVPASGAARTGASGARPGAAAPPRTVSTPGRPVVTLDRVIAVVNDEALTQYDLDAQKRNVLAQMKTQNVTPPPNDVIEKQLLERLITERAIAQYAKETGVRIDDAQVERTIQRIAQDNKMSPDEFRRAVEKEGIPYAKYREEVRNEMMLQRLRDREVDSKIVVSDAEVDNFLASMSAQSGGDSEYRVAHILVLLPEQASPDQIDFRRRRAQEALQQIKSGGDFAQVAASFSDAPDALKGGDLGWRAPARLPTVFVETVRTMKPGDISGVLRSPSGFHIVKLLDVRSRNQPTVVEQTHARHILVKVSEITSESEARIKIDRIKDRIDGGAKFEEQARLSSEDGSSSKGGDLGWISPGDTVPDFESAMNRLKLLEVSGPVRSPFGWHLIQVLERRTQDVTAERQREQARSAMRQRKSEEAFQEWVRQLRDRAYVELKADER